MMNDIVIAVISAILGALVIVALMEIASCAQAGIMVLIGPA